MTGEPTRASSLSGSRSTPSSLSSPAASDWLAELSQLADVIDGGPPAQLDTVLDAAARAFTRFGASRTSVNDIAREAGISRSSVYRVAGTPDAILRMVVARDLRQAIVFSLRGDLPDDPPAIVVQITATFVDTVNAHPLLRKMRVDEPELIAARLTTALPVMLALVSGRVATLLEPAIASGSLAFDDAESAAQLIVRMAVSCVISPPAGDVRTFLSATLLPALSR